MTLWSVYLYVYFKVLFLEPGLHIGITYVITTTMISNERTNENEVIIILIYTILIYTILIYNI